MNIDKTKCNSDLGAEIKTHLEKLGIATPVRDTVSTTEFKIEHVAKRFQEIMEIIGLDLRDDSMADTPVRVAKMYVNELFYGLNYDNFPKCTTVQNKMKYNEMVLSKDIDVKSTCEHHFIVIDGFATVAYIPKDLVIGLSKLNRIVDFFSRRPQIQERLTEQIYHSLSYILKTDNVAVVIDADHHCLKSRGAKDDSRTTTSKLGGVFKNDASTRAEFMSFVNKR